MNVLARFSALYDDLTSLDPSELDKVYHQDIRFDDPVTTHQGLVAVKLYFQKLLTNTESCRFTIHHVAKCVEQNDNQDTQFDHLVTWTMHLTTKSLNKGKPVNLDGSSLLAIREDRIIYHRDYYDMGQMVYEHVPILGFVIRKIKQKLAAI